MTLSINIKGIKEVQDFLKNTDREILLKANQAIIKAGFFIQSEVVESIAGHRAELESVDTGRFMGSVKASQKQDLTVTVDTNVEYAKYLEYGTSRIAPRRHFNNTAIRNINNVKNIVVNELKNIS